MNDIVKGAKVLEIPDVKIYEAKGNELSVLTKGTLEVIYFLEFDRFVLRANSFQYALSPFLPVMASLSEPRAFRSYALPSLKGCYVLKLKSVVQKPLIDNFETVLAYYSQFSYKTQDGTTLSSKIENYGYVRDQSNFDKENQINNLNYNQPKNAVKNTGYIEKGGEVLKQNLIKAANYLGKAVNKPTNENVVIPKSIDQLKSIEPNTKFINFPGTGIAKLISISGDIERKDAFRNETIYPVNEQRNVPKTNWENLKKDTTKSAKSIWAGMSEAFTIVSHALDNRKTNQKANVNNVPNVPQDVTQGFNDISLTNSVVQTRPIYEVQIPKYPEATDYTKINEDDTNLFLSNPHNQQLIGQIAGENRYPYIEPASGYNPNYYQNNLNQK